MLLLHTHIHYYSIRYLSLSLSLHSDSVVVRYELCTQTAWYIHLARHLHPENPGKDANLWKNSMLKEIYEIFFATRSSIETFRLTKRTHMLFGGI